MDQGLRLWRARRRHDRIDAVMSSIGTTWILEYWRNDRLMVTRRYDREAKARSEAEARLAELLRVGWIDHW
jgi:hypothetical protein